MGELPNLSNSAVLIERGDLEVILRALVAFQQASSEAAEIILRRLDNTDGDPDREDDDPGELDDEPEDDDPGGQCDEDGINTLALARWGEGPGCPISDPGGEDVYQHQSREF